MSYLRDTVIVLKKEPFREQDRRYTMYGRGHGLLVAVARGSSTMRSKQAGHLEPFMQTQVMIAKGTAFDKLAVASHSRPSSIRSLSALAVCGAVADLVIRLTRPGIADDRIFHLLVELISTVSNLPQELSPERARLMLAAATLRLLDLIGFAPHIERGPETTTPVPSLTLVSYMRRAPFVDVLRVTAPVDVLHAASDFVEEALKHTPLHAPPHGPKTIQALLAMH
jgi:DNA repair protein RecO